MDKMKIPFLSIDPSMRNTGWSSGFITGPESFEVDKFGIVATKAMSKSKKKQVRVSTATIEDCRILRKGMEKVIEEIKPKIIFAETPSGSKSSSAMKGYGISCFLLSLFEPNPIEVSPLEIKKMVNGTKSATKEEVIGWVLLNHPHLRKELPTKVNRKTKEIEFADEVEHICDSIAAVHAGMATSSFSQILNFL